MTRRSAGARRSKLLAVLLLAAPLLATTGCSDLQRVSGAEFLARAREISELHTLRSAHFIGVTERAAYLECWEAGWLYGSRTRVLWAPLDELPPAAVERLAAGAPLVD